MQQFSFPTVINEVASHRVDMLSFSLSTFTLLHALGLTDNLKVGRLIIYTARVHFSQRGLKWNNVL